MEATPGWGACRRCQGLVNLNSGQRNCFEGVHNTVFSAEYRAIGLRWPETQWPDNVQRGWGVCNRCSRLVFRSATPGVCYDGAAHEFDEFSGEYGVPFGPDVPETEPGWRWCSRCQCLTDNKNAVKSQCFAGGDHDFSGSLDYAASFISVGLQGWWEWCIKCQGLVQSPPWVGVCHDGSAHVAAGFSAFYVLPYGVVPEGALGGWRLCEKCGLLAHVHKPGVCYAGGAHDDSWMEFSNALVYSVLRDTAPYGAQPGWRRCGKCQSLSYGEFEIGPCPAGGTHDHSTSGVYSLFQSSDANGQPGWRRCAKCNGLGFIQLSPGVCRDGAPHDFTDSLAYSIPSEVVPSGAESSWRLCSRCQVLVYGGGSHGICVDGAPHDLNDSVLYGVPVDFPPEGAEAGWRRCARCQELAFNGSGVPDGVCADGAPHDFTDSPAYSIAAKAPPVEEPEQPAGPAIAVTESAASIVVDGSGFKSGSSVELSFVAGAARAVELASADDQGGFQHIVASVVPRAEGGLVLARQDDGALATGRLHSFVPASTAPPPG
jgi:hypothetical protein